MGGEAGVEGVGEHRQGTVDRPERRAGKGEPVRKSFWVMFRTLHLYSEKRTLK